MGCPNSPISPCSDVTVTITGNTHSFMKSGKTTAAPKISDAEWKLDQSTIYGGVLYAKWGPSNIASGNDVSCATKVEVAATCPSRQHPENVDDIFVGPSTSTTWADELDPPGQGTVENNQLANCVLGDDVTVIVTYMSGEVLTETKSNTTLIMSDTTTTPKITAETTTSTETTSGARNVYPQNVLVSSGFAIILSILHVK
ncbi:unnamed protein product [Meganyctiphanes norvegica]|uniref:Uncharacterized protein n=1 Tax=Meganyctiphanes norvegica TaxID=48144 RepID=A0AAV2QNA9_MEGNR